MLITSLLLFLTPRSDTISNLNTVFGLLFIISSITHLIFNFKSITGYIFNKKDEKKHLKKEFIIALLFSLIIILGTILFIPPFSTVINLGKYFREIPGRNINYYETFYLDKETEGSELIIELKSGEYYSITIEGLFSYTVTPQFAIWIEYKNGDFVKTIFSTSKGASNSFWGVDERIEALPVWFHKRHDSNYNSDIIDSISGASPISDFTIIWLLK